MPVNRQDEINDPVLAKALTTFAEKMSNFPGFVSAILFGSYARKEAHPGSDVDVAVIPEGKTGEFVKTKFAMNDVAYAVLLDTGIRIQSFPVWQSEWDNPDAYSNPLLIRNIAKDGVRLDLNVLGGLVDGE